MRFHLVTLTLFMVMAVLGLNIIHTRLLQNAQNTGTALARSYSVEEQNSITVYETLMNLGTAYISRQDPGDMNAEEMQRWLQAFFGNIVDVLGESVDPYAVVDGTIVAANPWGGDADYDYASTEWYQKAVEADGEIIFTDAYTDAIYDKTVVTIAQKVSGMDCILAFDIFPENFRLHETQTDMPEGSSYFLCDHNGTLLYYSLTLNVDSFGAVQEYVQGLFRGIQDGSLHSYDATVRDLSGNLRGVYYWELENGWYSIVTIPHHTILSGLFHLTLVFAASFGVFLLAILFMVWKDYRLSKRADRASETVRVLGNSYYAIYRVDYWDGTYEMIKGSKDIRMQVSEKGPYETLLDAMTRVIEEGASREFMDTFSIQSIQQLVAHQARDFGGDFMRLFDDGYKWVNVRLLFDESLDPGEVVLCFREVDEEKRQQLQQRRLLENALDTAKRSEKAKNAFFNNMSHDMRTPLNAIIGLAELVRQNLDNREKVADYMQKITFSSQQLLGLINDILEMSRLEQGKVSLDYHQFNLKKCIGDCVAVFQAQAEREHKNFSVSFDVEDTEVMGDFFRIGQILNNLLSNAFKYSKEGADISVRIKQFNQQEHNKYQIVVEDTGAGMSPEFVEKIFEPYARETRFGARNVSGTGLGMPIVKSLVTQMSGQITVESELGKGSTFTVTIPLEVIPQEEKEPAQKDAGGAAEARFSLEGKRILLAEDNEFNMEIATELLSMNGIEVTQAWNGQEAVDTFRNSVPFYFDAILMDMQMPEMDGCEAARTIRAMNRPDARHVPIVAVTANAFAEDIALTTEAGMNAHVSKPIDFAALYSSLEEIMEKKGN